MAKAVSPTPINYDTREQAGAHAMMVAIHDYLIAVGLTLETVTGMYDVEGSDTQNPMTIFDVSPWLHFSFTDEHQGDHPITVSFAMRRLPHSNNTPGYARAVFLPVFRVSEGVDLSTGDPLGRYVECMTYFNQLHNNNNTDIYRYYPRDSKGDFARYTGDSLTLIMVADGARVDVSGYPSSSMVELHIERVYSASTGHVQSGFAGIVQPTRAAVESSFMYGFWPSTAGANNNHSSTPTCFADINGGISKTTIANIGRAGGGFLTHRNGTPIVAPVYYKDDGGNPNTFRRLFTISKGAIAGNVTPIALDFTGTEKPYLPYFTQAGLTFNGDGLMNPPLAFLFEWE